MFLTTTLKHSPILVQTKMVEYLTTNVEMGMERSSHYHFSQTQGNVPIDRTPDPAGLSSTSNLTTVTITVAVVCLVLLLCIVIALFFIVGITCYGKGKKKALLDIREPNTETDFELRPLQHPRFTDSSTQTITLIDKDQLAEDMADSSSAHNFNENGQQNVPTGLECAVGVEDEASLHSRHSIKGDADDGEDTKDSSIHDATSSAYRLHDCGVPNPMFQESKTIDESSV